jgi:hypothetical protein
MKAFPLRCKEECAPDCVTSRVPRRTRCEMSDAFERSGPASGRQARSVDRVRAPGVHLVLLSKAVRRYLPRLDLGARLSPRLSPLRMWQPPDEASAVRDRRSAGPALQACWRAPPACTPLGTDSASSLAPRWRLMPLGCRSRDGHKGPAEQADDPLLTTARRASRLWQQDVSSPTPTAAYLRHRIPTEPPLV